MGLVSRVARRSTYQDGDPLYATVEAGLPDALWRRALRRAELPPEKQHRSGDTMLDAATAYLCGVRAADVAGDNMWRAVLADVEGAVAVHGGDALHRAILEARILSRQSTAEIAGRSGLSVGTIVVYEAVFFSVRDKLHATIWINCHAIALPTDGAASLGAVLRKFGYHAGTEILEFLVPIALGSREGNVLGMPVEANTEDGRAELSARIALAFDLLPRDPKVALFCLREHVELLRREQEIRRLDAYAQIGTVDLAAALASVKWLDRAVDSNRPRARVAG